MTREEMLSDLAYARTLAEEGRHAPLLGGAHLMFWGVLNTAAFGAHWAQTNHLLPFGNIGFAYIWISYGVAAGIGMTWLRIRVRKKPGVTSIGVRAESAVWMGAATAILAVVAGSLGRLFLDADTTGPNAIVGACFALYGAALFAVAALSDQKWMARFGLLSVLLAGALCLFANTSWVYLLAAAGSLLVLAWPGAILLKREPSAIV